MLLFAARRGRADLDAPRRSARWSAASYGEDAREAARAARDAGDPRARARRRARPGTDRGLAAGGQGVLGDDRAARSPGATCWISIPALLLVVRGLDGVVGGGGASCRRSASPTRTDQLFWLAALPGLSGATLRIFYSFMVPIFGGRLWTTLSTWSLLIPALGIGYAVQNPETPYWIFLVLALLCGFGGGNFASSMANISLLLPEGGEGQRAGAQRRPRQPRRQRRAVRGAARHHRRRVRLRSAASRRSMSRAGVPAVAAERRLRLGAVHRRQRLRGLVRHERHRRRQGLVRRAGGDLPAQAQLDHVLALHRHLRLLHRLFGGLPAARQDAVPRGQRAAATRSSGRWSARCRARRTGWVVGQVRRRPRHLLGVRRHDRSAVLGVLYFLGIKEQPGASGASSPCSCSCSSSPASATRRPSR